jgi:hypothetical protein
MVISKTMGMKTGNGNITMRIRIRARVEQDKIMDLDLTLGIMGMGVMTTIGQIQITAVERGMGMEAPGRG